LTHIPHRAILTAMKTHASMLGNGLALAALAAFFSAAHPTAAAQDLERGVSSQGDAPHANAPHGYAPPETLFVVPASEPAASLRPDTYTNLPAAIEAAARALPGTVISLAPGEYALVPSPYTDPTCGNCEDPARAIPATLGLRVCGQAITLRGASADQVRIVTRAGYGLLFEDCEDCRLEGVTVTGGVRDTCGLATDAAVVVRRSKLTIERCRIAENTGVMGICGREGSEIHVRNSDILRNSWDGVALYRDAYAEVRDCVIDGIDRGAAGPACGGRGVAIGITWNAQADVVGNLVRRYWKGIGVFVDAQARIRENIVEDILTWGISLWDADKGRPFAEIIWNAVDQTGSCGISITRGLPGGPLGSRICRNAIRRSGQNPRYDSGEVYCYQRALAIHATTPEMEIANNICSANREPGDSPGRFDQSVEAFRDAVGPLLERLRKHDVLSRSAFLRGFSAE
jgi:hypothetical protein